MIPTDLIIATGLIGYLALAVGSATLFDRRASRSDYPMPGQYEVTRFMVGALWFLWPWLWATAWLRRRSAPSSRCAVKVGWLAGPHDPGPVSVEACGAMMPCAVHPSRSKPERPPE